MGGDSAETSLIGTVSIGPRVGSGLLGTVWRGRQEALRRDVAVKFIKPSMVAIGDAVAHARALAQVSHSNVVTIYDVMRLLDPDTGELADCVLMEWLEGETLWKLLARPDRISANRALGLATQLLDGLAAIHRVGLAHGDLHAGNVVLTSEQAKIIDINYFEAGTFSRLTATPKSDHRRADVESLIYLIGRLVRHSDLRSSEFGPQLDAIHLASDLPEIRAALTKLDEKRRIRSSIAPTGAASPAQPKINRHGLSDEQIELLLGARRNEETGILVIRGDAWTVFRAGGEELVKGSPLSRAVTTWSDAVVQLQARGLFKNVYHTGMSDQYALTVDGFKTADQLAAQLGV
jgi:serine/threonine protein kinase